ncbi:MAG: Cys-Xaa-Xaa-Xaa repeat radical SAM target protein [Paraprevotella sp.]|nr:Cys-Xaa-Xaa-Xaa repeat radical SAM target protein [Paraprevotella sp.]
MKKKNQNEELQSRREFFKKAAKSALPILGAVVLAGAPAIMNASEKIPMGCEYGCSGSCYGRCDGSCQGNCYTTCSGSCRGTCQTGCTGCRGLNYSKY